MLKSAKSDRGMSCINSVSSSHSFLLFNSNLMVSGKQNRWLKVLNVAEQEGITLVSFIFVWITWLHLITTNDTVRKLQYAVSLAMSTAWVWKSVRWVWTMASQNCVQAFHDKMSHMNDMLKPKTTWLNLAKWETSSPHLECYTLPQKISLKTFPDS